MADNRLIFSLTNPVRMFPVVDPVYDQFDTAPYKRLVPSWIKVTPYAQKWLNDGTLYDPINFQFQCNFGSPYIQIIDCRGNVLQTVDGTAVPNTAIRAPFVTYQFSFIPPIMGGVYYFVVTAGIGPTLTQMISEPQLTIKDKRNTLMFRYYNTANFTNLIFSTNQQYYFRCEGGLGRIQPKIKGEDWEDQPLNLETVLGITYREFPLIIGGSYGVPDWVADKVNHITAVDRMYINDLQFTRPKANQWEAIEDPNYSLAGFTTLIRQTVNNDSIVMVNGNSPSEFTFTVYDIISDLFGTMNDNGINNPVQITKLNF